MGAAAHAADFSGAAHLTRTFYQMKADDVQLEPSRKTVPLS